MFVVYCFINTVNGKMYVGKSKDPEYRWVRHRQDARAGSHFVFHRAIRLYGEENFRMTILSQHESEKDAFDSEIEWVRRLDSTIDGYGYNMTRGGEGTVPTTEVRVKMSKAQLERYKDPEEKIRNSQRVTAYFNTPGARERQSEIQKVCQGTPERRKQQSENAKAWRAIPENSEACRQAIIAVKRSPESRARQSESTTNYFKSPEARQRQSELQIKRFDTPEARERIATAVQMYKDGHSVKEITKTIDRSEAAVRVILKKAGVYEPNRNRKPKS